MKVFYQILCPGILPPLQLELGNHSGKAVGPNEIYKS